MTHLVGATSTGLPDGSRPEIRRAHEQGLVHFSTHLLAVDATSVDPVAARTRVIARRRASDEPRYAGLLTTTVGGHVETGFSPADALSAAAGRHGVELSSVRYVGTFEVSDDDEREICTLWTGATDFSRATARFESIPVARLDQLEATPHLVASLALWRAIT